MLDKIVTPNFRYGVNYAWTNQISLGPLGKSANWSANPSFSLDVNLKPITEAIWPSTPASVRADTGTGKGANNTLKKISDITRILIKNTLFDFEKFNFSFTQSNSAQNNGVRGSNGFANLFARVPFFQSSLIENGPSLYYQLGLMSDPNGRLVLKTKGAFPFITGYTVPGLRASDSLGTSLLDTYSQNNNISVQTSRPLWEGATLDLNWKVGWGYSENKTSNADSSGLPYNANSTVSGNINRSYISLPSFLMFKFFNTNLENVNKKYVALKQDVNNSSSDAAKLSQAFEQGLEAFPWLTKILGSIAPRANWAIRWGGLESFSFLKSFATSVSLDHSYSSTYTESWKLSQDDNKKEITTQSVMYGFAPLIGLNITFKDLAKGKLSSSFRYNATTTYNLTPSSSSVGEDSRSDIAVSGTFSRQGFEIPFFGLSLMNNIDISITYSYSHNTSLRYDFNDFQKDGLPMGGTSTTTIEPRIRYTLSERVTASLYYRYSKLSPDAGGSTISGSTTNEGGLDINIAIK
jgi:hypothetical protein